MARPRKLTKKQPVKLTLSPSLRIEADKLAFCENVSLSELVERLLKEEIESGVAEDQAPYKTQGKPKRPPHPPRADAEEASA